MQSAHKVVVVGNASVGKTAMSTRYRDSSADIGIVRPTVGQANFFLTIETTAGPVPVNLWDTAGQEQFRTLSPLYFRDAAFVVYVFAIDDRSGFEDLNIWIQLVKDTVGVIDGLIVGNKSDLINKREVEHDEAYEYAYANQMEYFETSALTGQGLNEVFTAAALIVNEKGFPLPKANTEGHSTSTKSVKPAQKSAWKCYL